MTQRRGGEVRARSFGTRTRTPEDNMTLATTDQPTTRPYDYERDEAGPDWEFGTTRRVQRDELETLAKAWVESLLQARLASGEPLVNLTRVGHLADDRATMAFIEGDVLGVPFLINKSARRHPEDHEDQLTGAMLAYGRAFRKLGTALMLRARERVAQEDRRQRRQHQASAA